MSLDRAPIFWTTTQPNANLRDRERTIMVGGKKVRERFPQKGHVGDYETRQPARFTRYVNVVRHDGHVTALTLTNAAAHTDTSTQYAEYQRAKARHFGWFPLGSCPCAGIAAGEFSPECFMSDKVTGGQPCQHGSYSEAKPCPHALAELEARRASNRELSAEREANFRDPTQKMIEAGREQAAAIAGAVKEAVAAAASGAKGNAK